MYNIFDVKNESCLEQEVDAIVNAANGYMIHGGGIARAILLKAGEELNKACQEYTLPISDGEVIVTPSFNIKNTKIIIHAVGPDFRESPEGIDKLYNAYYNSLIALKNNNYHSISFPLISAGIFSGNLSNPVKVSTIQCKKAYNNFIDNYPDYHIKVLLCCYTKEEFNIANQTIIDEFPLEELLYGDKVLEGY